MITFLVIRKFLRETNIVVTLQVTLIEKVHSDNTLYDPFKENLVNIVKYRHNVVLESKILV